MGQTADPASLFADEDHVLECRADVLCGDVATAEGVDEPAVRPKQPLGSQRGGIADDDGLAATEVESGDGSLVCHGLGQPQNVLEGRSLGWVWKEAGPAESGTKSRAVNGDDRLETTGVIYAEQHLLMGVGADGFEYSQRLLLSGGAVRRAWPRVPQRF